MSQFQILYKQKNMSLSSKENSEIERNNRLESRRVKRSQAFDSRRKFVFEDPEPLEPVKNKVNLGPKNKLQKYRKKIVKKQPPPFVVGKVRHKIHSPPFLHGPKFATEPKKRIPLTPVQSFAPKNYKFKANYISKATTTTPSKQNNTPFTFESLLNKNNAKSDSKNKENYFKNVTVRPQRRKEIKDSPTTSLNPTVAEYPIYVFGRRNLEEEFKKSSKNSTKDSVNFERKTLTETLNVVNYVNESLAKMSQLFLSETNSKKVKNNMTGETIRLSNVEHKNNHGDMLQMLSPNLSSMSYSPVSSTPIFLNECQINFYSTPQSSEKKDLAEKAFDNEDLHSDSTSPTLNQTMIELDSTISSIKNTKISPDIIHLENSPKLPDITSPTDFSSKKLIDDSKVEHNPFKVMSLLEKNNLESLSRKSEINQPYPQDGILKSSVKDELILVNNADLVVSADIEKNTSDLNEQQKHVEENQLNLISRLSLSSPETTAIIKQSQQRTPDNVGNEKDGIPKLSVTDELISVDNADLVVSADIEKNTSDLNEQQKEVEENQLNLISRLSLSSPETTAIIKQSQQRTPDNVGNEKAGISKTLVADASIVVGTTNLVINAGIETNTSDLNKLHRDIEENELNLLSRSSSSTLEKHECAAISIQSSHSPLLASYSALSEQDVNVGISTSDKLTTLNTTRSLSTLENITNKTFSKQLHNKVAERTNDINVLSSLENHKNVTNFPASSKLDLRTYEENKSIDRKIPHSPRKSPRLSTSLKTVSPQLKLSPVRVLRRRLVDVSPSPKKGIPKKRNATPRKSSHSLCSKIQSLEQPSSSPLNVLNLRNRKITVTPSPNRLTPRSLKPYEYVREIDEDNSPTLLSINQHTKCNTPTTSPQTESTVSTENNSTPKDLYAGVASAQSVIAPPLIIRDTDSPNRRKSSTSKPLTECISGTVEDKLPIQTIDLLSDDEDESTTLLKNIMQKYSLENYPSSKSKNRSAPSTQKLSADEEDQSKILSNILKKYSSNTPSPKSKDRTALSPIKDLSDLYAGVASAQSVIGPPLIIRDTESSDRRKSFTCKPLTECISGTAEDKLNIQTIDLLSDDEDESTTLLKNILQKYSLENCPSSKSKNRSALSTQKLPADEEEQSIFLSNILKKYSPNTPSPKSKNRTALTPIENLPIICISPSKSPRLLEVPSPHKIGNSPLRTLALRRRLVDVTPSPKKTPKKKINVTPRKSPHPALFCTKENSPQQTESPLRILCLRKRDVAVTPSPKKLTPRRGKNDVY